MTFSQKRVLVTN